MDPTTLKAKAIELSDPTKLDYQFKHPPLLVAGMALMYYGLRESGKDIDFILHPDDHQDLALKFRDQSSIVPEHSSGFKDKPELVDYWGDHGIIIYQFEIWDYIFQFGYDDLKEGAVAEQKFLVISLEKLLVLCAVRGLKTERYMDDAKLIAKELTSQRYKDFDESQIGKYWPKLLL